MASIPDRLISPRIVILDRDGVINIDSEEYIKSAEEWQPIDGSLEAIARLSQNGFEIVIATNQSGLARGFFSKTELEKIHDKLILSVEELGGKIAGIFHCPHGPSENCDCRKPKTGLLKQIENKFDCSLSGAPFIGDSSKDILAGQTHGCLAILVETGNGKNAYKDLSETGNTNFLFYKDLSDAVDSLLKRADV